MARVGIPHGIDLYGSRFQRFAKVALIFGFGSAHKVRAFSSHGEVWFCRFLLARAVGNVDG